MIISNRTRTLIENLDYTSNQPIIISGPDFLYKEDISKHIATNFLDIASLENYPYIKNISTDKKNIGIDEIRDISRFISLSVPINKPINRIVFINNAEKLSNEAQNALLKNLEETPMGTLLILVTKDLNKILTTIQSRARVLEVSKPSKSEIIDILKDYDIKEIEQNYILSDGAPRLIQELLENKESQIQSNIDIAKKILSSDKVNKLSYINSISKTRDDALKIVTLIKQMSKLGSLSDNTNQSEKWQNILDKSIEAESKLRANSIIKLTLLDFFLGI